MLISKTTSVLSCLGIIWSMALGNSGLCTAAEVGGYAGVVEAQYDRVSRPVHVVGGFPVGPIWSLEALSRFRSPAS
jgi:hypothetical protein